MTLKLIACNVLMREACWCIARSPHIIDPVFIELGRHVCCDELREDIRSEIAATEESGKNYDAILLLYGLCGNATVGLRAEKTPVIIPRAHDCCTILLGSSREFSEQFGDNPSRPFSSVGYMERGEYYLWKEGDTTRVRYGDRYEEYVKQYGEENARYIWETMHASHSGDSRAVFIEIPETAHLGYAERFREKAEAEGLEYVHLTGSLSMVRRLIDGEWDQKDFLRVEPSQEIKGVYDFEQVMTAGAE